MTKLVMKNKLPVTPQDEIRVLNQLLAAQSMLHVFLTIEKMGEFAIQALKNIPGINLCSICFFDQKKPVGDHIKAAEELAASLAVDAEGHKIASIDPPRAKNLITFRLQTFYHFFGYILILVADKKNFEIFHAATGNFVNMMAMHLENQWQINQLEFQRDHLEEEVKNRSADLIAEVNERKLAEKSEIEARIETGQLLQTAERSRLVLLSVIEDHKEARNEVQKLNEQLEQRIIDRTAQLEASNQELEAFSYSVSHDLRAPLRHISGYVDLLTDRFHDSLPEKGKHYLDAISDSAHQMGVLIDNLLQFSRTSRLEMQLIDLDMNNILQEALKSIEPDTSDRNIKWIIAQLPHVFGDHNLLLLVWINLLSNAVKFTRAKKKTRIEIGFREENKEYLFFVRDNGAGFDMQYAHKLFGVFQRLHSSAQFEGTGIGLANVHRIILKHGGRTWAEAELDKGATFYFTLPRRTVSSQQSAVSSQQFDNLSI